MTAINIGTFVPERLCKIPEGATVVEMKYCELCGKSFSRRFIETRLSPWEFEDRVSQLRRDQGERLCEHCRYTPFPELRAENLLKDQDNYRDQLPNLDSIHASSHPIRYDKSVAGRQTSAFRVNQQTPRKTRQLAVWRPLIEQAFRERSFLTLEHICELMPHCFTLPIAYARVKSAYKERLVVVARMHDINGRINRGPAIFKLVGVTPEVSH